MDYHAYAFATAIDTDVHVVAELCELRFVSDNELSDDISLDRFVGHDSYDTSLYPRGYPKLHYE